MKVVVTDYIHDDQEYERRELTACGHEFAAYQLKFKPEEEVYEHIRDAEAIVVNMVPFPRSLISRLNKCKLIIRHGIGYDNVDVAACTDMGIQFVNQPDYCQIEVAEHAIALIMACARKISWSRRTLDESAASGQWDFSKLFPLFRMEGKTLGLLGVGRIGFLVAKKMSAFGMNIIAYDPLKDDETLRKQGVRRVELNELFSESDFISIHTPLDDSTRHIINRETLAMMKPQAYIINTSRAGMVDTDALIEALLNRSIAGAALDVYVKEPPQADDPLLKMENLLLTPHIGWASVEAGWEIRRHILDDLKAFAAGGDARYVINPETKRGNKT